MYGPIFLCNNYLMQENKLFMIIIIKVSIMPCLSLNNAQIKFLTAVNQDRQKPLLH